MFRFKQPQVRSDERSPSRNAALEIDIELGDWCGVLEKWCWVRDTTCAVDSRFLTRMQKARMSFPPARNRQRSRDHRTIRSGDLHVVVRPTL